MATLPCLSSFLNVAFCVVLDALDGSIGRFNARHGNFDGDNEIITTLNLHLRICTIFIFHSPEQGIYE